MEAYLKTQELWEYVALTGIDRLEELALPPVPQTLMVLLQI